MKRKSEAEETLKEEEMLMEGSMTFSLGIENYVILFGYHEEELNPTTSKEINIEHKMWKNECLQYVGALSQGYFIKQ